MGNRVRGAVAVLLVSFLAACGGDGDHRHTNSDVILGDAPTDGYVEQAVAGGGLTAVQGDGIRVQSPTLVDPERRGFASFLITSIPVGATIDQGELRLYVDFVVQDSPPSPVLVDIYHVHYGDPLTFSAFNTPATFVTTVSVDTTNIGSVLVLDVLPELQQDVDNASNSFFQLMLVARGGVVEFQDAEQSLGAPSRGPAPELDVVYF